MLDFILRHILLIIIFVVAVAAVIFLLLQLKEKDELKKLNSEIKSLKRQIGNYSIPSEVEQTDYFKKRFGLGDKIEKTAAPKTKQAKNQPPKSDMLKELGKNYERATASKKPQSFAEIYLDKEDKFRFRFKSIGGQIIAHSQGYSSKEHCMQGIIEVTQSSKASVVDISIDRDYKPVAGEPVFELYRDNEQKYRFRLRNSAAKTILASAPYSNREYCKKAIECIKKCQKIDKMKDKKSPA